MLLVGIAVIGMTVSSMSAASAYCKVKGSGIPDIHQVFGVGIPASCVVHDWCGTYDGYVKGQEGNGVLYANDDFDCFADGESLTVISYNNYYAPVKICG